MLGKALLSASVSAPPAVYVEDVFSTYLYTGNGSTQTITNGIDLSGEGGLVWLKSRSAANYGSFISPQVGALTEFLIPSLDNGLVLAGTNVVDTYLSNGFTLNQGSGLVNQSPTTYCSWTFRKAAKFFDVVTYTGNGSNRTIAHNLGSVPGCIIVKRTDTTSDWSVYHRGVNAGSGPQNYVMLLNTTAAQTGRGSAWNDTAPTSTVFSLGTHVDVNASGGTYVAYLFAHDAGGFGAAGTDNVVSCGSYTGGYTSFSPVVDLGWEPQWVMIKKATGTSNGFTQWGIWDNMKGVSTGGSENFLAANYSDSENSTWNPTGNYIDFTATGFTVDPNRAGWSAVNASSETYIYIAIRRGPMKTPTVATEVFEPVSATLSSGSPTISTASVVVNDALFTADRNMAGAYRTWQTRLTGGNWLDSASTGAETSSTYTVWDLMSRTKPYNYNDGTQITYNFRRAPGFFDVVAYTGTGSTQDLNHNLGVAPELIIFKKRSASANWYVHHKDLVPIYGYPSTGFPLNLSDAFLGYDSLASAPTSTIFRPTSVYLGNSGSTYIAYLFATLTSVSKVGGYTGTGTTLQINCGFTAGARFVMIKRVDSTGDWYVWDTARGIISGNDSYLLLNSTAAEVTNTDYIDPLASGFEISSTAPAAINANGGTYIFLAIA